MDAISYEVFVPLKATDGLFVAAGQKSPWLLANSVSVLSDGTIMFIGCEQDNTMVEPLPNQALARLRAMETVPVVSFTVGGVLDAKLLPCRVEAGR